MRLGSTLWLAAGLVALAATILGDTSLQWVALPVLAVSALALLGAWPARLWRSLPSWCREAAGPAAIVILCTVLYARLLIGDFPVNHDHPVFLLHAWVTGTQLIPSGSLTGFSESLFAGYPANSLYPMGTSLLICAIKALGLGLPSWELAYCWALFLAILAYPLALYALGRRALGPLAGLAAGILGVLDRGSWFQSGWDFNLNWGVWSMGLSFALCLWSVWGLDRLLLAPRRFTLIGTATAITGAVLCHPMAVALLGFMLPLYVAVLVLGGKLPAPGLWLPRVVAAGALGAGLCSWWLLPFVAHQEYYEPLACPWRPFEDVIRGLIDGNLLNQFAPVLVLAGLIGLALLARRRNMLAWFLLVGSGLLLFFSTNSFLLSFKVLKHFPAIANLQLERFAYFIRSALLLGAGLLIQLGLESPAPDGTRPLGGWSWRRHMGRLLVGLILAPLVLFIGRVSPNAFFIPTKPLTYASESDLYRDVRAAADALNQMDRSSIGRVAVAAITNEHLLLGLAVHTGLPLFKVGFTPEDNYRYKFESRDPEVWKAVGVSHLLSIGPTASPQLEEMQRFGRLFLYRFRPYQPQPFALSGPGSVRLIRAEPEALDFELKDCGPDSRLVVYRSRYALWRAEINGQPAQIQGASVGDSPPVFMELPARDGTLSLRYRSGGVEWTGRILSWLAALALALLLASALSGSLRRSLAARFVPWAGPIRDATTLGALAVVVVLAALFLMRFLLPGPSPFPGRRVIDDLSTRLPQARAEVIQPQRSDPCAPYQGGKIRCPGPDWNFAGEVILPIDHMLHQCVWLHPIQGAKFSVRFDDVPLGESLQGQFGMDDGVVEPPGPQEVKLNVLLDGVPLGTFGCPSRRGWFSWEAPTPGRSGTVGQVILQSEAVFTGRRHFCFTAYSTVPEDP